MASESDRDEEQPAASRAIKHDVRYPTPEFMRLLVELGRIVEREDRLGKQADSETPATPAPRGTTEGK